MTDPLRIRKRLLRRLEALDKVAHPSELPKAWNCRPTHEGGDEWQVDVDGPWRIFFYWRDGDAYEVDYRCSHQ